MKRSIPKVVAAVLLAVLVSSGAGLSYAQVKAGAEDAKVLREMTQVKQRWILAFKKQRAGDLVGAYDPEGAVLTSSGKTVFGRNQIIKVMASEMELLGPAEAALKAQNRHWLDGMAYETGRYSFAYLGNNKEKHVIQGRYVLIWRKGPEGWKFYRYLGLPD